MSLERSELERAGGCLCGVVRFKATLTGDSFADDLLHMGHLRKTLPDAPQVRIVIVPGQSHYVASWLKEHGQLARLVSALWAGDRQGLEDCSKALPRPLDLTLA